MASSEVFLRSGYCVLVVWFRGAQGWASGELVRCAPARL